MTMTYGGNRGDGSPVVGLHAQLSDTRDFLDWAADAVEYLQRSDRSLFWIHIVFLLAVHQREAKRKNSAKSLAAQLRDRAPVPTVTVVAEARPATVHDSNTLCW